MDNQKALRFAMQVVAVILGITLFKQFDFETMRFAHWPHGHRVPDRFRIWRSSSCSGARARMHRTE
jgi:hypothetical protein